MYYNPSTQEKKSRMELKALLHASIPSGLEQVGDWYLLHNGTAPATEYGQSIAPDTVELIDGKYTQTFKVVGTPQTPEETVEDRLTNIEDALVELAGIITEGE